MTLLAGVGTAVDLSGIGRAKAEMQNLADATALAAAISANNENPNRRQIAMDYYRSNISYIENVVEGSPSIQFNDSGEEVSVTIRAKYNFAFMDALNLASPMMESFAVSNYGGDYIPPFSIAFVFDVSGSMGWDTRDGRVKMNVLKQAAIDFYTRLGIEAKQPQALLDAMTSSYATYNTGLVDSASMQQGNAQVLRGVANMRPGGGTNSTPAMSHAFNQLRAMERNQGNDWTGYVIFMTDGDNNQVSWDRSTLGICRRMKSAGYEVFTVAFDAPSRAKRMLGDCATDAEHFLDASSATEMTKAFDEIAREVVKSIVRVKT